MTGWAEGSSNWHREALATMLQLASGGETGPCPPCVLNANQCFGEAGGDGLSASRADEGWTWAGSIVLADICTQPTQLSCTDSVSGRATAKTEALRKDARGRGEHEGDDGRANGEAKEVLDCIGVSLSLGGFGSPPHTTTDTKAAGAG